MIIIIRFVLQARLLISCMQSSIICKETFENIKWISKFHKLLKQYLLTNSALRIQGEAEEPACRKEVKIESQLSECETVMV